MTQCLLPGRPTEKTANGRLAGAPETVLANPAAPALEVKALMHKAPDDVIGVRRLHGNFLLPEIHRPPVGVIECVARLRNCHQACPRSCQRSDPRTCTGLRPKTGPGKARCRRQVQACSSLIPFSSAMIFQRIASTG